jgi:hypothetical protein
VSQFTLIARTIGCRTFRGPKIGGIISEMRLGIQWCIEQSGIVAITGSFQQATENLQGCFEIQNDSGLPQGNQTSVRGKLAAAGEEAPCPT